LAAVGRERETLGGKPTPLGGKLEALGREYKAVGREREALGGKPTPLGGKLEALGREYKRGGKRWEENTRRWEENAKRWEENQRRWEENWKRWEENTRRWEENERRWQENDKRWERAFEEFRWIRSALTQIQEALGVSLEFYTAQWIREWLAAKGFTCNPIVHAALLIDGIKEVDVFCPDPLVVAEVKSAVPTVDEADRALEQLRRAVEAAEKFARTRIYAAVLAVETAPEEVARYLQAKAGEAGYLLVLGRKAK